MTIQGQLAESGGSTWPPRVPPLDLLLPMGSVNAGLLGNAYIQTISVAFMNVETLMVTYRILTGAQPSAPPLTLLKRQKFTTGGRRARIEASLAALDAPQPTELSVAQWKAILEEVEDED